MDALLGDPTRRTRYLFGAAGYFVRAGKMIVEHDIDLARPERTVNRAAFTDPARGAAKAGASAGNGIAYTISYHGRRIFVAVPRGIVGPALVRRLCAGKMPASNGQSRLG